MIGTFFSVLTKKKKKKKARFQLAALARQFLAKNRSRPPTTPAQIPLQEAELTKPGPAIPAAFSEAPAARMERGFWVQAPLG